MAAVPCVEFICRRGLVFTFFLVIFCIPTCFALLEGIYCGKENCYDVLELTKDVSKADISKAYRQLAKKFHPDMHHTEKSKVAAEEKFLSIANAYEILRDDDARKDYDYMLENPDEMYRHYYRYYRRTMAPKVDVRIVIIVTISVISVFQYFTARQRYSTGISYCASQPKYRLQALNIAKEEGLLSDNAKRKSRKTKEEQKEMEEAIIRKIIEDKMDIKGGFGKPNIKNVLWVQLFLLPITIAKYVWWNVRWIWKFYILNEEYGKDEKLYLIRKYMGLSELVFSALNQEDFLYRELWIKEKFQEWKKIQEEEQRAKLAQNNKYKSYRRYIKSHGVGQITFDD